ncbi:hypothetical protein [Actinomadura rudentiformis]|uniref:Uncharacterized protein n=1 Tax=Actinomadura rudentiformis TaxID=359158 RepID=A0A6H9Z846_9ACTN|nr:hypothetical protein [Actinomadura rudentiformis]KAB2350096.1 hypothetical protein F8566_09795 [Actinomadura rudentiformis]
MLAVAGCGTPKPRDAALPASPKPCSERTSTASPKPTPTATRVPWRAEEMGDGSVRMTVGDIEAAPRHPDAERVADHRAPFRSYECDTVRITKVRGWWCTTTVEKLAVSGEIVVGGAKPRAQVKGAGFRTRCSGRPGRMRQHHVIQRDSWSSWRSYGGVGKTAWTSGQEQGGGRVTEVCPKGRVGSYNYRLSVNVESDSAPIGEAYAVSARIRADCGTGLS